MARLSAENRRESRITQNLTEIDPERMDALADLTLIEQMENEVKTSDGKKYLWERDLAGIRGENEQLADQFKAAARAEEEERRRRGEEIISRQNQEQTEDTSTTIRTVESKRSAKFPDPEKLSDGKKPVFREWHTKLAYIKTRVEGEAASYLYPYMEARDREGQGVTTTSVLRFLKDIYEDPNKRSNARDALRKLKMKYLQDFNTFQAEFTRLANEANLQQADWKEELHERLYDSLQVQMALYAYEEDLDFYGYCRKASSMARSLKKAAEARKERRGPRDIQNKRNSSLTEKDRAPKS
ncbi:MAG: hypothetical protein Q9160_009356 [Pyrenula sp. 1 TL-2023]